MFRSEYFRVSLVRNERNVEIFEVRLDRICIKLVGVEVLVHQEEIDNHLMRQSLNFCLSLAVFVLLSFSFVKYPAGLNQRLVVVRRLVAPLPGYFESLFRGTVGAFKTVLGSFSFRQAEILSVARDAFLVFETDLYLSTLPLKILRPKADPVESSYV